MTTTPTSTAAPAAADTGVSQATDGGVQDTSNAPDTADDYISDEEWAKLANRKVKRKIDGKDVTISLADYDKGYGHTQAANKRFEEAAAIKKQAAADKAEMEKMLAQLKDPKAAKQFLSKHLGEEGFSNLAHEHVMEAMRREAMSPEELQAEQDSRELDEYRAEKKRQQEADNQKAYQAKIEKMADEMMADVSTTLSQLGVQPQPYELDSLIGVMLDAMEQGMDLSPLEAWNYVQKQEQMRMERYLAKLDVTKLPKQLVDKVRQHSVAELPFRGQNQQKPAESSSKAEEKVDASDFFANLRKGRK